MTDVSDAMKELNAKRAENDKHLKSLRLERAKLREDEAKGKDVSELLERSKTQMCSHLEQTCELTKKIIAQSRVDHHKLLRDTFGPESEWSKGILKTITMDSEAYMSLRLSQQKLEDDAARPPPQPIESAQRETAARPVMAEPSGGERREEEGFDQFHQKEDTKKVVKAVSRAESRLVDATTQTATAAAAAGAGPVQSERAARHQRRAMEKAKEEEVGDRSVNADVASSSTSTPSAPVMKSAAEEK